MTTYGFRDPIVNISGLVLLSLIGWQLYLHRTGDSNQESKAQKHLSVLIPLLVVYLFSVPVMYPDGDLWAIAIVEPLLGSSSGSFGVEGANNILSYIDQEQPSTQLERIILWLKLIGMVVHIIIFVLMSIVPRVIVVGYDNIRDFIGLNN